MCTALLAAGNWLGWDWLREPRDVGAGETLQDNGAGTWNAQWEGKRKRELEFIGQFTESPH